MANLVMVHELMEVASLLRLLPVSQPPLPGSAASSYPPSQACKISLAFVNSIFVTQKSSVMLSWRTSTKSSLALNFCSALLNQDDY
jgi:hypothetical protein